ncbi:hypothetical protein SCP_0902780 [Sparassis crispa]|uniref:Uncharacterized protein n=1 Tax=Sparassis crispa TaxID=139825 RepID=A0A401GW57_9APHY|nr:hypothetical protein SCP_0902780 [Sparassis crispa]GBE86399.1 hypothetical protein SCP_0902780 [Sparassis crispa]
MEALALAHHLAGGNAAQSQKGRTTSSPRALYALYPGYVRPVRPEPRNCGEGLTQSAHRSREQHAGQLPPSLVSRRHWRTVDILLRPQDINIRRPIERSAALSV